jgi:expansin
MFGLSFAVAAATILSVGSAAVVPAAIAIDADATFTQASIGGGTCSFSNYTFPDGLFGAGLGPSNWAGGGKCGSCLQVDGPRASVRVMVLHPRPLISEDDSSRVWNFDSETKC